MVSGIFDRVFQGTFGLLALELRVCLCGLGHVLNVPCWSSLGQGDSL